MTLYPAYSAVLVLLREEGCLAIGYGDIDSRHGTRIIDGETAPYDMAANSPPRAGEIFFLSKLRKRIGNGFKGQNSRAAEGTQ